METSLDQNPATMGDPRSNGEARLTLEQMLARFDPELHGGETMTPERGGKEVM